MAERTCSFITRSCAFGGAWLAIRPIAKRTMPETPAAGSPCPQFAFILPTCNGSASPREAMMAALVDRTSIGSPKGVPVPCASRQLISDGGVAASDMAARRSCCCAWPFGA
eukprot:scaffold27079_cov32-Tisochrysis_lutea.AAC.3